MTGKEPENADEVAQILSDFSRNLDAWDWIDRATWKFRNQIERAQSDIFQALWDGKLPSTACFSHYEEADQDESVPEVETETVIHDRGEIPAAHWGLSAIDWKRSTLAARGGKYVSVRIEAEDFFKVFPRPRLEPIKVEGFLYGDTVILDDITVRDHTSPEPVSSRGRP